VAERVVKVKLQAQVSEYEKGMLEAARATRSVGTEAEKLAQKKEAFDQMGRGLVVTGAALTTVTALSVKAAMDWESAWAGVTKTVSGSDAELQAVEDGLRGLTAVLPASHAEIAAVAEAAGQLGIQTPNVVAFTKTMIDLGETTNLSANDAATALARFTNIMGTSQDEVDNLGSALVGLGNNYATTESEILEMSMRLAGAGKQIGLSEGDVLGLATALSSVGIEAEAGGSAMSKVMIDIASSVEAGGDRLEMFASVAGVSASQFAEQWRTAPSEALAAFVKGLSNAEAQGSSTLGVLAELGITEVRMRDALLRSSSAADMFSGAMARGNEEFEANNALTLEAAKRYETVESRIAIAGNAVRDAAINFGEVFLPAVGAAADGVTGFAQFLGGLPDPVQGLIGALGGAAGVLALVGGTALLAVPKIAQFKVAMETMGWSMRTVGLVGGGALVALTALVAVVGAVSAAQAQAQQKAESYANTLAEGTQKVTDATRDMAKEALAAGDSFLWMEKDSAFDAAEKLGVSLDLVTDAAMGNKDAMAELYRQIDENSDGSLDYANASETVKRAVEAEADALEAGTDVARQKNSVTEEGVEVTQSSAEAYMEAAAEAGSLNSELSKLIDTILASNGVGQDAVSANARYQSALEGISAEVQKQRDAYEEAQGTLDGFTLSLDESTAAGANNASMLADVAGAAQNAAQKQYELDLQTMSAKDATDKYAGTLAAQRQAFIDSAIQAGYNADEVQRLADKVFALPSEKELNIIADTAQAERDLDHLSRERWARVNAIVVAPNTVDPGAVLRGNGYNSPNFEGNLYDRGKAVEFYQGGFASGIYAGVQGGIHKFAESEMGVPWETYISGRPADRDRNVGIWQETGRRLGVESGGGSVVIEGARITGSLDLGNGLVGVIDGRIADAKYKSAVKLSGGGVSA